jgi:hypothetical protein
MQRRTALLKQKAAILQPVIDTLDAFPKEVNSPWKNCSASLNRSINKMMLLVYSKEDEVLHAMKLYFASFMKQQQPKNFRGVQLKSVAELLFALVVPEISVVNVGSYIEVDLLLPAAPEIRHSIKHLKHQGKHGEITMLSYCADRGKRMAHLLRDSWTEFGQDFVSKFAFDIHSIPQMSLSSLTFKSIWLKYTETAGVFHQGIKKMTPYFEQLIRDESHGGYSWSCQDRLNAGDPIHGTRGEPALSIMEYDISSSYGYATSTMKTPTGFGYGYIKEADDLLVLCNKNLRHKTFEFKSVYYTLKKLGNHFTIKSVYSNFHQLGFMKIANYPLDLAIVMHDGTIKLYNFDGQYAHGCPLCPPLKRYVGNKSRREVEGHTAKRDAIIHTWVNNLCSLGTNDLATYEVLTDCHDEEYTKQALDSAFDLDPVLANMVDVYPTKNKCLAIDDVLCCSNKLTYIARIQGFAPNKSKPLLLRDQNGYWHRRNNTKNEYVLLTRDYLDTLRREHNFIVTDIESVLFYKNCTVLPDIYKELVNERALPSTSPSRKQLLKKVVNFSCGFFGFNPANAAKSTHRLVTNINRTIKSNKCFATSAGFFGNEQFYLLQVYKEASTKKKRSPGPLPLFFSIVEFGKLRMAQILCFFEKYTFPNAYRHLYSHVDNVVIALSDSLYYGVPAYLYEDFKKETMNYFEQGKPGHLKREWILEQDQEWKFASSMVQNWAAISKDTAMHKNSALNNVSSQQSYEIACAMLDERAVSVPQKRRLNKMLNRETVYQTFNF